MEIHEIEKSVPIPEVHSKSKFPWSEMKVGDSVLIQADENQTIFRLKQIVGSSARYYGDKTGKIFKIMLMREENGVRVWRIE